MSWIWIGIKLLYLVYYPGGSVVKNLPGTAGDLGLIPGSGRPPWRRKCQPVPVFFYSFIYFNWRLNTSQYFGGFCHTSTWISHGYTCVTPSWTPSHLPPHPTAPVFLSGEYHGLRSPVGYSPWGHRESGHGWVTNTHMSTLFSMSRKKKKKDYPAVQHNHSCFGRLFFIVYLFVKCIFQINQLGKG